MTIDNKMILLIIQRAIDYLCEHLLFLVAGHNTHQINMVGVFLK